MIDIFNTYITAQRDLMVNFYLLAAILLLVALLSHLFIDASVYATWFKLGLVFFALLIPANAYFANRYNDKVEREVSELYNSEPEHFIQSELERMSVVARQFPYYSYVYVGLILLALVTILFVPIPAIKGVALSLFLFVAGVFTIEQIGDESIYDYYNALRELSGK